MDFDVFPFLVRVLGPHRFRRMPLVCSIIHMIEMKVRRTPFMQRDFPIEMPLQEKKKSNISLLTLRAPNLAT